MKPATIIFFLLALVGTALGHAVGSDQDDAAAKAFWGKFRAAVIKGDRQAVAALSQFPIGMSYGVPRIRTKAQLLKRYREVFNAQTNAVKCFDKATPEIDAVRPKEFSVVCKDAAGNEVVVYAFHLTPNGWRFASLDNLNE